VSTTNLRHKKIVALNVIKKFCVQARNILTNLKPNFDPTYNSEPKVKQGVTLLVAVSGAPDYCIPPNTDVM